MSRLTLVRSNSKKNYALSPTLSSVPFKMLPIGSLETYRVQRLERKIEQLAIDRPVAFEVLEKLVENLIAREHDRAQTR